MALESPAANRSLFDSVFLETSTPSRDEVFVHLFEPVDGLSIFPRQDGSNPLRRTQQDSPNWRTLADYYRLKDELTDGGRIDVRVPVDEPSWFKSSHINNPIFPQVARSVLGFNLTFETHPDPDNASITRYYPVLEIQPIIGYANLHNVAINPLPSGERYRMGLVPQGIQIELQIGDNDLSTLPLSAWFPHVRFQLDVNQNDFDTSFTAGESRIFSVGASTDGLMTDQVRLTNDFDESRKHAFSTFRLQERIDTNPGPFTGNHRIIDENNPTSENILTQWTTDATDAVHFRINFTDQLPDGGNADNRIFTFIGSNMANQVELMLANWLPDPNEPLFIQPGITISDAGTAGPLGRFGTYLRTTSDTPSTRFLIDGNLRSRFTGHNNHDKTRDRRIHGTLHTQAITGTRDLVEIEHDYLAQFTSQNTSGAGTRFRGYHGSSIEPVGETEVILFDVPRQPLHSLASFQHANLSRFEDQPTYPLGNSFASPYIRRDQIDDHRWTDNPDTEEDNRSYDVSWRANHAVYDGFFFSTIPPDWSADDFNAWMQDAHANPLPSGRFLPYHSGSGPTLADLTEPTVKNFRTLAASLMVEGAFNVNSTSVEAWEMILGGLKGREIAIHNTSTGGLERWQPEESAVISRFSAPMAGGLSTDAALPSDPGAFWRGYRRLSDDQIRLLAEAIVKQVKLRGPFRSMSDFVNRRIIDPTEDPDGLGLSGALQAALNDPTTGINEIPASVSGVAEAEVDTGVPDYTVRAQSDIDGGYTFVNEHLFGNAATGFPGYVLQADLLQVIEPMLTVRSDTFVIRVAGISRLSPLVSGRSHTAYAEAVVQRVYEPVDGNLITDPDQRIEELDFPTHPTGRQFRVISFRWLNEDQI
jgi:hypothetical protein